MALLANNTQANPYNSFYALAGGGGGDTLQSPVSLIPEANGNQQLNIVASTGSGEANILLSSTNGNAATMVINSTGGGDSLVSIGQTLVPGGAGLVDIIAPGAIVGGGQLQIQNGSGATPPIGVFDTVNNQVLLGGSTTTGLTTVRNGLLVRDDFVTTPSTNGIGITMTSAHIGVIAGTDNTGVTNYLQIGSSQNATNTIVLSDTGADTAECLIGGNGGTNLAIIGGTVAQAFAGANIRTDAASSGILTLGSSTATPTVMFVKDPGPANTGFVDVAGGIPASIALRLQGANTQVGANTAQVSTNNVDSASPTLNISNSVDGTPKIVVTSLGTTINGTKNTITADTTFTTGNCIIEGILGFNWSSTRSSNTCGAIEGMNNYTSVVVTCGDNSTATIPQPTGYLGEAMETGLYFILGRNSTSNNVPWQSVSAMGYWTGSAWVGGGGCCPALVSSPPSFLGIQGGGSTLLLANGSGLGTATMIFYFQQIGGLLGMS